MKYIRHNNVMIAEVGFDGEPRVIGSCAYPGCRIALQLRQENDEQVSLGCSFPSGRPRPASSLRFEPVLEAECLIIEHLSTVILCRLA
jgi:hypothetical protein